MKTPPFLEPTPQPDRRAGRENDWANRVPAAKAAVQVSQRKNKTMALLVETMEQLGARVAADEKKNGKRYKYEFDLVKAWLECGGRVIPKRYDGYGTYLYQNKKNQLLLGYVWTKPQFHGVFCDVLNLDNEGFIIVPMDYEIPNNGASPEWFIRTKQK